MTEGGAATSKDLDIAKKVLFEKNANLVVVRDGEILFLGRSNGLGDLAEIVLRNPGILKSSSIADRIVGKAAAVIYSVNRVKAAYACLLSKHGLEVLEKNGVEVHYERLAQHIEGRDGGICPFERLILEIGEERTAYRLLLEKLREILRRRENII